MDDDLIKKFLKIIEDEKGETKKRHPFAKGDGIVIWENTSQKTGEKYYNVQVLGNKGIPCFKPKEAEE